MAVTLGAVSAGASLVGGLSGMFGGGNTAQNVQLPPQFQMPNMTGAANNAFSGIGGLQGYNTYNIPGAQGFTQNIVNNPYVPQYQGAADFASQIGSGAAVNNFNYGNYLQSQGAGNFPMATSLWQVSADPQSALFNRLQGQVTDQTRAANAAAGVGTTPYGASVEANALSNFDINWQNNELQRMLQGGQGVTNLQGAGTNLINAGGTLNTQAPQNYLNANATPWGVYNTVNQTPFQQLQNMGAFGQSASTLPQTAFSDYMSYLGAGNQAGGVANQNAQVQLAQAQAVNQQNQQFGNQIGAGLQGLGKAYTGMGGTSPFGFGSSGSTPTPGQISSAYGPTLQSSLASGF